MARAKDTKDIEQFHSEILNIIKGDTFRKFANDGFVNPTLNQGYGTTDPTMATDYETNRGLTWNMFRINQVERDNPLLRKILSFRASKPLRKGIDLNSKELDAEQIKYVKKELKKYNKELHSLIYQGEAYGGSASLICIKGQMSASELIKPLNYDRVQPGYFLGLKNLERWYSVVPDMTRLIDRIGERNGIENPNLIGQPLYFKVRLTPDSQELLVHRSRLLIYNTGELPMLEKRIEQFWGVSSLERLWQPLNEYYLAVKYALGAMLFNNQRVVKIDAFTDMATATNKAKEQIKFKLELMKEGMNYSNILFLSSEDEVEHHSYSLADVDDLVTKQAVHLASCACVPYSWLFNDNQFEQETNENAFDSIKEIQENYVRDYYNVLIKLIFKSKYGGALPEFDFEFKPIKENDDKTIAEIISKVSEQLINLFKESVIDKETLIKALSEITNNISDIYNNFTPEFVKKYGDKLKIDDQIELAKALNQGKDNENAIAKETIQGGMNEKKPTPRPKIVE